MEAGIDYLLVSYHRYGPDGQQQLKDLAKLAADKINQRKINQPTEESPNV